MKYTIKNKKMYKINDDGTLTEKIGVNLKTNIIKELRKHVEKEVKEDKEKKAKMRISSIPKPEKPKAKRGRPRKAKKNAI